MISIITLMVVVVLSILVVRIASVALTLTGLSQELARFEARSAFTGAGFTTTDSEKVVHHPVRRRIIMLLMLFGNAGLISAVSTLLLSFVGADEEGGITQALWFRVAAIVTGLLGLWAVAHSRIVDKYLSRAIAWSLKRWTKLEVRDYAGLLHLSGDYSVVELLVRSDDWMAGRHLRELRLDEEGVLVLGIELEQGGYVGAPRGKAVVSPGDTLLLYGPRATLAELDLRRSGTSGNWRHFQAVDERRQAEVRERQMMEDHDAADRS